MNFEWDEAKRQINLAKHCVDFVDVAEFWESMCVTAEVIRSDCQERRWVCYGLLRQRVMVLVYTQRRNVIRVISFRKANKKEVQEYEKAINQTKQSAL